MSETTETKSVVSRLKALEKRGLNGREAWRCCVRAKRTAQKFIQSYADEVERISTQIIPTGGFVEVESPSRVGRVTTLPRTVSGGPAALILIGWILISGIDSQEEEVPMPRNQYELELVQKHLRVVSETIRKTEEDCLDCVEKRVWGQSKRRRRGVWVQVQKAIGEGANKMLLRVPHR